MRIYIPTRGRPTEQSTFEALPKKLLSRVLLVVPKDEQDVYEEQGYPVLAAPEELHIPEKRQFILEHHLGFADDPRLIMMDDDLHFGVRRKDHPGRFLPADGGAVISMLALMHKALEKYPHVGICPREQGHRHPPYETHMQRMQRVLGYDARVLEQEGVRFDRLPLMEDFDVALQLLRRGYATCMITEYIQGQDAANQDGGCSTYRTPELQQQAAEGLKELHPECVRTVERKTKGGWFGDQPRMDVRVSWQKAYEEGLKVRSERVQEEHAA